jgi:hypothetical protein
MNRINKEAAGLESIQKDEMLHPSCDHSSARAAAGTESDPGL